MKAYKFDFATTTLIISADFAEKAQDPKSIEYSILNQFHADFPNLKIAKRTHKTPKKYHNQNGSTTTYNQHRKLTYENMERFIKTLPNSAQYLNEYNFLKSIGNIQTSGYHTVSKWFLNQFPKYQTDPSYYIANSPVAIKAETELPKTA